MDAAIRRAMNNTPMAMEVLDIGAAMDHLFALGQACEALHVLIDEHVGRLAKHNTNRNFVCFSGKQ